VIVRKKDKVMIDNIKIKIPIEEPPPLDNEYQREDFKWLGEMFRPKFNKYGLHYAYENKLGRDSNLNGLKLTYDIASRDLIIVNSLHKFWKRNNHSDFTFSDIQLAIQKLESELDLNLQTGQIVAKEYAINIQADNDIYINWSSYKHKSFTPMKTSTGKIYGAENVWTNFKIKGYNKTFQVKAKDRKTLPTSIFRFEIEAKKNCYFNSFGVDAIRTVKDLSDPIKIERLGIDLLDKYDSIEKGDRLDFSNLTGEELKRYATMQNPLIKAAYKAYYQTDKDERKVDGITYKRCRATSNKVKKKIIVPNYANEIRSKIEQKIGELLAN